MTTTIRTDYLKTLLDMYYPAHFFALFRAHELYNVEPYLKYLEDPILDLGCGDGVIGKLLFGRTLRWGIDLLPHAVEGARASGVYETVFEGDAHHIPLPDNSVGSIYSNCVLEHIPDMPGLIAEIARVLKPGGCFVATCLAPQYYELNPVYRLTNRPLLRPIYRYIRRAEDQLHNHVSIFSKAAYDTMFRDVGMALEKHAYYAPADVMNFTHWRDTPSKFSRRLRVSHSGWYIGYLNRRYPPEARDRFMDEWYPKLAPLCYQYNEPGEEGAAQILVARKSG
jgi:SAM-dependent methyltransferase